MANATISDRNGLSLGQELQAQTGFSSYIAYLATLDLPDHRLKDQVISQMVGGDFRNANETINHKDRCFITDVSTKREPTAKCTMQLEVSTSEADSGTARYAPLRSLSATLRSHIEAGRVRIVHWFTERGKLDVQWVDIIGLELRVPPSFFMAVLEMKNNVGRTIGHSETRFSHPEHQIIGDSVATFLQDSVSLVPTILIAHLHGNSEINDATERYLRVLELLDLEAQRRSPATPFRAGEFTARGTTFEHVCRRLFYHYQKSLCEFLQQQSEATISDQCLFYTSLLPLIKIASMDLQVNYQETLYWLSRLRSDNVEADSGRFNARGMQNRNQTYNIVDSDRYNLRRACEEFDNGQQCFKSYIETNGDVEWLSEKSYKTVIAESDRTIVLARRLEVEVRDYMQLVVGAMSIAESRKSIELSTSQINEGEKGSLPTMKVQLDC
ncbi:MAG: hypothetical protein L6R39_000402 [Caloplaca ligustica]|nr:MAG: hypothetical protein L6R39_000402 [Caloplaca ligustica]